MPKNKKIKRRQKGGNQTSENLAPQQKTMSAGSNTPTWGKYNHTIFLWIILMLSVAGLVWFLLSRSLTNSPLSYISLIISHPPINSFFTYN